MAQHLASDVIACDQEPLPRGWAALVVGQYRKRQAGNVPDITSSRMDTSPVTTSRSCMTPAAPSCIPEPFLRANRRKDQLRLPRVGRAYPVASARRRRRPPLVALPAVVLDTRLACSSEPGMAGRVWNYSTTSQPPGLIAAVIRSSATSGLDRCPRTRRAYREIECPVGNGPAMMSWRRTLTLARPDLLETPRVDVGGQSVTARAHTLRQPTGDRAQAAADLEARPPIRNARREKMTDDVRIVDIRECCEPLALSSGPG